VRGGRIRFCADCGSGRAALAPGFDAGALYSQRYFADAAEPAGYDDYAALEPALRANFARRLRAIPMPTPRARLLDLGAAYGYAVEEAARQGWRACGVEISLAAARAARAPVVLGDARRLPFADASFDAVTLWDVLEHLPDPHAAIAEVARCTRAGGHLALTTGDVGSLAARISGARWHLYTLPEHVFFYSRRGLAALCAAHGLRVVGLRAEAARYPLGYLVERLRKTLFGRGRGGAARWPGAGRSLPVNLFDIVTLHAVREGGSA
jgi:SAM-dependent methyltransferase